MKSKTIYPILLFLCCSLLVRAQDTFSIVAVDSVTGEVGSAGASCVGYSSYYPHGAAVLSDVIPGIGGIHTQASYLAANQQYAHELMLAGVPPQQMIDSLVAHDAQGNPTVRQYGIVSYNNGHPLTAAYTGINCMDYKNDTAGIYYSIQGNILLGQLVIDSMQNRFLNTTGTLADRLMAALQGAKMIGADTRCAVHNSSSLSSFLRVARPTDNPDTLYLDLWMAYSQNYSGIVPVDPIDSLQTLYDIWKTTTSISPVNAFSALKVWAVTGGDVIFDLTRCADPAGSVITLFDMTGRIIWSGAVTSRLMNIHPAAVRSHALILYRIISADRAILSTGKIPMK